MLPQKAVFTLLLVMLLLSFNAVGHVPLIGGGNEDISSALHISNPAKSWAIYAVLENETVHYFSFDVREGERIYLGLLKSTDPADEGFLPDLLLIGPGIGIQSSPSAQLPEGNTSPEGAAVLLENSAIPKNIVLPESLKDLGALAADGREGITTYEPFGPSSFIELAEINLSAPQSGWYYAAVYENTMKEEASLAAAEPVAKGGGHYGLVVGYREEFSFTDRMIAPIQIASVYIWEGQSIIMILIPYLVALIAGGLIYRRGSRRSSFSLAGTFAGFLFLGTSSLVITQMIYSLSRAPYGPEVYITMAIILFHALLGVASIRLARGGAGILQRSLLAVIGTLALLGGSGMILGPILAVSASFLPTMKRSVPGDLLQES
ncbi:MAG: hypothetical protein WBH08_13025 [Methanothrix sp.]|uniref:hypothetical protein n=1 Tax=Methanothrix sp. TaxID=90426 RepID=UPI003BB6C0FE